MTFQIPVRDTLLLKIRTPEDAPECFALVDKNRESLRLWLPWVDGTKSTKDTEEYIKKMALGFEEKKNADFGILFENKWIGSMGFNTINSLNKKAEIGYWLDADYRGKGIMRDCVRALCDYGFNERELNRIVIKCAISNEKSRAVPVSLGFTLEGTLREDLWCNGVLTDAYIYSMLKSEWKNK